MTVKSSCICRLCVLTFCLWHFVVRHCCICGFLYWFLLYRFFSSIFVVFFFFLRSCVEVRVSSLFWSHELVGLPWEKKICPHEKNRNCSCWFWRILRLWCFSKPAKWCVCVCSLLFWCLRDECVWMPRYYLAELHYCSTWTFVLLWTMLVFFSNFTDICLGTMHTLFFSEFYNFCNSIGVIMTKCATSKKVSTSIICENASITFEKLKYIFLSKWSRYWSFIQHVRIYIT